MSLASGPAHPMRRSASYPLALAPLLLASACWSSKPATTAAPTVLDARRFYAAQPRHLQPVGHAATPAELPNLWAETCGACHTEIYAEWRLSTHARALRDDAQFMAELAKSQKPGSDVGWMCLNCHTPLENQLPRLVTGLVEGRWDQPIYVDNPGWDRRLTEDAITCLSCHLREGQLVGVHETTGAPHAVRADPAWLRSVEVCTQCHQAQAEFPSVNLACVFDTGAEHAASPQAAEGKTCQSCHMPEVERALTNLDDQPIRRSRRHWFGGSLIPKHPRFAAELAPLRQHYPDGLTLGWVDRPPALPAGAPARLAVAYENTNAGHRLPSGDPERYLLVRLELADDAGKLLASEEHRIGSIYEWWPKTRKLSDNRLAPKERRTLEVRFTAPERGRLRLHLSASKWRISEENMKFHDLVGKYVPGATFYDEQVTIPVTPRR